MGNAPAAAAPGESAADTPTWAGGVDAALVTRLQRPAQLPGVVRLGHARDLLARHRAMVPGVPLADALLQRVPEPGAAREEVPVVTAQPVPGPDPLTTGPTGGARATEIMPAPVPVVRPAVVPGAGADAPVPDPPAGPAHPLVPATNTATAEGAYLSAVRPSAPPVSQATPGSPSDLPGGNIPAWASGGTPSGGRPPESSTTTPGAPVPGPVPGPVAPAATTGLPVAPPVPPAPRGPAAPVREPAVAVGPARVAPPGRRVPDLPAPVRPSSPPPRPDLPGPSVVVVARPADRLHAVPVGGAGEPGLLRAAPVVPAGPVMPSSARPAPAVPPEPDLPVVRPAPVDAGRGAVRDSGPVAAAAPAARESGVLPVVRPAPADPVPADEIRRLVVRELARSAAPPIPALPLPVPAAPPAPAAAPGPPVARRDAPTVRADRVAEPPRRAAPPVDVGRITDAVSRRLARRGALEGERRGMNR